MILAAINWAAVGTIIGALVILLSAALGFGKWMIDHEVKDVNERQKQLAGEFRPNGGASFRDHFDKEIRQIREHFDESIALNQRLSTRALRRMEKLEQQVERLDNRFNDFDRRRTAESQPRRRRRW